MSQPLEIPTLRDLLTSLRDPMHPQVILRLGYGPTGPATPRRPLADVLLPAEPNMGGSQ